MLRFDINVNGMSLAQKALAETCTRAEHIVSEQVMKDTIPFVPALNLSLSNRTRVVGSAIIYPGPYARYLYYGKLMVDPATGSSWAPRYGRKVLTNQNLVFNKTVHPQAQAHWFDASKAQNLQKWIRIADKAVKKFGKT